MEYYQQHKEQQRAYYQQRIANKTPEEKAARLEQQHASVIVSNPNYQQESILENLIGLDSNKTESFSEEYPKDLNPFLNHVETEEENLNNSFKVDQNSILKDNYPDENNPFSEEYPKDLNPFNEEIVIVQQSM